jgi:methylphosphotriester-DNA--protein-cysteine methyltransferase
MEELSELFKLVAEEKKKLGKENNLKNSVLTLEKKLHHIKSISYSSIDQLMRNICSKFNVSPEELHNAFKKKHKMIPDDWIKKQKNIFKK